MPGISPDQLNQLYAKADEAGIPRNEVLSGLRARGITLDSTAVAPDTTQVQPDTTSAPPDTTQGPAAAMAAQRRPSMLQRLGQTLLQSARDVNSMLPAIGGAVGGSLGGIAGAPEAPFTGGLSLPGGVIGGGMLGAGAGRMLEQTLAPLLGQQGEVPQNIQQAYGHTANSATGGAIPGAIERGVAIAGPALAEKFAQASLRNGFGDPRELAQTMLQYGINNTRAGLARITNLVKTYGARHNELIQEASSKMGPLVNAKKDILEPVMAPIREDMGNMAFPGPTDKILRDLESDFTLAHNKPYDPGSGVPRQPGAPNMTLAKLNRMKELADNRLRFLYDQNLKNKTEVAPERDFEERALQGIGNRIRDVMYGPADENGMRTGGPVSYLHELEQRQSRLLALKANIGPSARKTLGSGPELTQRAAMTLPMMAAVGAATPGGAMSHAVGAGVGGLAGAAASSPQALSGMALLMSNPALAHSVGPTLRAGQALTDVAMSRRKK